MTSRLVSTIFRRSELDNAMLTDPVSKFRVSQPETLIDTDFEYGLQSTKWETIELVNNIPVFFAREGDTPIPLSDVYTNKDTDIVQVTTQTPSGFIVGAPFLIKGLSSSSAEGSFVVLRASLTDPNVFYYKARSTQTYTGSIYDSFATVLYVGRLYQSTQYTADGLINIITNGDIPDENGNASKLTVTTKYPHGFRADAQFILANSMGARQINFDASLIDPDNTILSSNVIEYTNSNNNILSGFRSRKVIPYDYDSKKTVSFKPSDISSSTIYIPNHGLLDSTYSSNLYLYTVPKGDQPITGLIDNQLYAVKKINENYISLTQAQPSYIPGLWDFSYTMGGLAFTDFSVRLSRCNDIFLHNPGFGTSTSTFNAGINIWTGFGTHLPASAPGPSPDATAVGLSNFLTWNVAQAQTAHLFFGYFKPIYSGVSNIEIRCLDYAKLWFGEDAVWTNGISKDPSASIPYLRTAVGVRTSLSLGTVGITTFNTPQVTANNLYPFRLVTATSNLIASVGTGNTISVLSLRIKENTQTFDPFTAPFGGSLGSRHLCNLFVAPIIGNGPAVNAPRRPLIINTTEVPLQDGTGTDEYGEHILQKIYPILNLTTTGSIFTTGMNTINYTDANISQGAAVTYVSPEYASNIPQFTRNIFASGQATATRTQFSTYAENLPPSYSNISTTDYKRMNASGRPGSTLSVGVGSYTNSTDMTFINGTGNAAVALTTKTLFQVSGILPVNTFKQYDAFYVPSHGYSENDVVTLTLLDNTKTLPVSTSLVGESAITNGASYKIRYIDSDFFGLKTLTAGTPIDIKTIGNAPIKFTITRTNPNKDTFYAPVHNLGNGTAVTYYNSNVDSISGLTPGATYYVTNATTNRFSVSTNVNNLSGSVVDITAVGTGTHYFQTADKDTDGNYVVTAVPDPYSFTLQSKNYIPPRVLQFFPPSTVNLNTYSFYLPNHRLATGCVLGYSNYSTDLMSSNIAGLEHKEYYAIRIDTKNIQLANNYVEALSNIPVPLYNYGEGSNHVFTVTSLQGEIPIVNSINLSNVFNYAYSTSNYSPNLDFLQLLKKGDMFTAEIPGIEEIDYYAASNDPVSFGITFFHRTSNGVINAPLINTTASAYNLNVGEMLQYQRYGVGGTSYSIGFIGLSNNYNYYVRPDLTAATRFFLYSTSNDALQDLNRVRVFNPVAGVATHYGARFVKRVPNIMFSTPISYINNAYQVTLSNNPYYNTSNASFITKTYLFPKADGYAFHRAFDGGVEMIPTRNPDTKFIRQTRRYFRYQSGKGMQCSKAVNFNAAYDVQSLKRGYNGITNCAIVETRFPHRIGVGASVRIEEATDSEGTLDYWNSSNNTHFYYVHEIPTLTSFSFYYPSGRTPTNTTAAGFPKYTVRNWTQSTISAGMFDDQNGLFFQYDGADFYAVRRNSTKQLPGFASVVFNSGKVVGNENSRFTTILQDGTAPEDNGVASYIVIKGCSYKVAHIESDTVIYIQPPYRGKTSENITISITQDEKVPQSQWSIDKCDGNGPTGYHLDITKIQMIYIDYSWYGAGKVRFGFKGGNGEVRYVHEFLHNNRFNEAYLRSGNLPGRYEVANQGNPTYTPALMHWGTSIIMDGRFDDDRAYLFTVGSKTFSYYGSPKYVALALNDDVYGRSKNILYNPAAGPYYNPNTGKTEYAYRIYSSSTAGGGNNQSITGYLAGGTQTIGGVSQTYESVAALQGLKAGTLIYGLNIATGGSSNLFGDWVGTTFDRRGNIQTQGTFALVSTNATILNTTFVSSTLINLNTNYTIRNKGIAGSLGNAQADFDSPNGFIPMVSLRLAPSVDNGFGSLLGVREIVNRMQLTLAEIGVLTTHDVEIQLRLNTYPSTYNWVGATPPSLCQYITHDKGDTVYGGTTIYSFRAQGGALVQQSGSYYGKSTNASTFKLDELATLGNAIIGGDNVFPDGPDILTIGFVLLDTTYITQLTPFTCTARISWKESQA